jgi:hypothetical protein
MRPGQVCGARAATQPLPPSHFLHSSPSSPLPLFPLTLRRRARCARPALPALSLAVLAPRARCSSCRTERNELITGVWIQVMFSLLNGNVISEPFPDTLSMAWYSSATTQVRVPCIAPTQAPASVLCFPSKVPRPIACPSTTLATASCSSNSTPCSSREDPPVCIPMPPCTGSDPYLGAASAPPPP